MQEQVKLDIKDKKLIYHLSENCRMSDTQLSRKIGLSKNAVKYRIERLKKLGVIDKFASVVNLGALNFATVTFLLKFNEDIYEKKEIIEYFKNHPFADWVITLSGQWDIFAEFVVTDFMHLSAITSEISQRFSESLNTFQTFNSWQILRVEHLVEDFYKDLKMPPAAEKERTIQKHKIDETDKRILHLLNQDSSLPYLQIAQKLNLTIDIVRYRIRNLMDKGIIIKFFSEISLQKLGYTNYLYRLKLRNISKQRIDSLMRRIKADKNIMYAFADITGLNIIFACAYRTAEGIDHLSRSLRKHYPGIIEEQDYLLIKEQVLFNLFPKGLVQKSI